MQPDLLSFYIVSEGRGLPLDSRRDLGQIAVEKPLDRLDHPRPARGVCHDIGVRLDYRQRVGDRDGAAAGPQERMIVFCVADPDDIERRQAQPRERGGQAARLVDPGREHHHRPLVEDDLQFQPEVANCLEHDGFIRLPRCDDAAADRERRHFAALQLFDEERRWSLSERDLLPRRRVDEERPVLEHGEIEQVEIGKHPSQIRQLPPADEDQLTAGLLQQAQRLEGRLRDDAVFGERAVVVGRERDEIHPSPR